MREELQKVFDVNRARLIKGLETVHSSLLSELLAEGVITGEQENTIKVSFFLHGNYFVITKSGCNSIIVQLY